MKAWLRMRFPRHGRIPGVLYSGMAILLSVAACTTPEPIIITKEVLIPITRSCIERPVEKPVLLSDGEILDQDDYRATISIWLDRRARQGYEGLLEAQIAGCR